VSGSTADELVAEACRQTGLDDLGSDSFREGLAIYCDSLGSEAQLNDIGAMAVPGAIVTSLSNRLRVVDWARRHPEVASEQIDAPLIVIGMFRAGTTFLSYLLDQDRRNRPLLGWESTDSVPPASPADHRAGPRVEAARAHSAVLEELNPRMRVVHHEEPDGPTECIAVMSQDFKSLSWEAMANVPTYGEWLLQTDQRSAYQYHRLALQVLQSGGVRGRWTLKSPHHAIALEALTAVYPDARLVLLHRDPVVLCASVCSLIRTLSGTFSDVDHQRYIADHWTTMLEESIHRIDAFRTTHPEHPIIDVQYADLVREPLATLGALYASFGDGLDDRATAAITAYIDSHPKGKLGVHGYDLGEFGLDGAELAERFAGYVARHDIPTERADQMT
jgi:sulfotransferase family protein